MGVAFVCSACGLVADRRAPFRCLDAGDGGDHVVLPLVDGPWAPDASTEDPFLRYRSRRSAAHLAAALGVDYEAIVRRLDDRIAAVDPDGGHGFVRTPFARAAALSDKMGFSSTGGVWIKDETRNVAGSHKARHLAGILHHLDVVGADPRAPLAIASCGNAALAASVLAKAAGRRIDVYIPPSADPAVVDRLRALDAHLHICTREPGATGDPCYHAFRRAVDAGAVPFGCQGPDDGLTLDGGKTLGDELVEQMLSDNMIADRIFVQVGGGALAASVALAFDDAVRLGVLPRMPRFHAVQTEGCAPLERAYRRLLARLLPDGEVPRLLDDAFADRVRTAGEDGRASWVRQLFAEAARDRAHYMWPWEREPHSLAHGILDDETYDWREICEAMLVSGGAPIVAPEAAIVEAHAAARALTPIDVDPTGAAGLAGLPGRIRPDEKCVVLFTGVTRR